MRLGTSAAIVLSALWLASPAHAATSCDALATHALPQTTITKAELVAAGAFVPPGARAPQGAAAKTYQALPAFCRVAATLRPSSDSDIKIEVWLPASGWNGKFQAVGNGGWNGSIPYNTLAAAVAGGYATAGTDTGHEGGSASFALGHPEKLTDFSYRAVHEMTVKAKAIIDAFYGAPIRLSIWNGCSQGGRQGVAEAVRYPTDYDAVIAGAPAVNFLNLHAGRMTLNRSMNATSDGAIPPAKYPAIHKAVLAACDAHDGVADGVIENPMSCRFDPAVLQCKAADDGSCLTSAQVESARKMYATVKHPTTGADVLPGFAAGAELGWGVVGGAEPLGTAHEAYKYVIAQDANWTPTSFNAAADIDRALAFDPGDGLASTSVNLRPFFDRGGKLLLYHGWSDPQVTPFNTVNYFNKVVAHSGSQVVGKSIQLYMVPGMNHCQGGPGTDAFDKVGAMEQWVQSGTAPAQIRAAHLTNGSIDRTRPLCPMGQVAKWNGQGSSNDAANFACVAQ